MAQTCSNPSCSAPGTKRCSGCNQVHYCSSTCQKHHWRSHKPTCKPPPATPAKPTGGSSTTVQVTMIHSRAEGGRYSDHDVLLSDPIFTTSPVPISVAIGYPLLVQRVEKRNDDWVPRTLRGGANEDNPHGTWLMIDPVTGFAPAEWQGGVGNVVVARADGEMLDTGTVAAITDYVSDILDAFGKGVGAARKYYSRVRLDKFIADHGKMQGQYKDFQARIARGEDPNEAAKAVYY